MEGRKKERLLVRKRTEIKFKNSLTSFFKVQDENFRDKLVRIFLLEVTSTGRLFDRSRTILMTC